MLILGIVGSPRKEGRTHALIRAVLDGAENAGARTQTVYLIDYAIRPLGTKGTGPACPAALSELCDVADAIAIGAPVYYGDINGLTKDFMDSVQLEQANGKPALGLAIAGGSGKGLLSGLQNVNHFLYHRQFRAIAPTPISRFNLEAALGKLHDGGRRLVEMATNPVPFPGDRRDDRWPGVLAHYATLPYLDKGPLDEFVLLAEQLLEISVGDAVPMAQQELDMALALRAEGRESQAARHAVRAYEILYFAE